MEDSYVLKRNRSEHIQERQVKIKSWLRQWLLMRGVHH